MEAQDDLTTQGLTTAHMRKFLSSLFNRPAPVVFDAPVRITRPTYAIGDIHGRIDLFLDLLDLIDADITARGHEDPLLVLIGDYVDRGENSREVLDHIQKMKQAAPDLVHALRGNHEEMLLQFLAEPAGRAKAWITFGGMQTLMSYGVTSVTLGAGPEALERGAEDLGAALGDHLDLLRGLETTHRDGNVFFAHAGADPDTALEDQSTRDLIWGAPGFLKTPRSDGVWVAHGHFIEDAPVFANGRIGLDTGAYHTGRLTAAEITDQGVRFLQT